MIWFRRNRVCGGSRKFTRILFFHWFPACSGYWQYSFYLSIASRLLLCVWIIGCRLLLQMTLIFDCGVCWQFCVGCVSAENWRINVKSVSKSQTYQCFRPPSTSTKLYTFSFFFIGKTSEFFSCKKICEKQAVTNKGGDQFCTPNTMEKSGHWPNPNSSTKRGRFSGLFVV